MKFTNASNLPKAIERAVSNDPYDSSGSDISTTRLIAPPRIRVLEKRNYDLLEEDVADRIFSLLGQSVHHVIERAKTRKELSEKRLFYKDEKITNGWTLSGAFDLLNREGHLTDFKVTSAWQVVHALKEGKPDWENQLNVLDFLCRKNPNELINYKTKIKVKRLSVMAILRDWSLFQTMRSDNYPRKQVAMIPIRRWTEEEQDNYVRERIKIHQNAEKVSKLPLCTATERWRKEDQFAVMKSGRKSALRLLDTKQLALDYLKSQNMVEGTGCSIVERKGEDVRCQHYCKVNEFCDYFMKVNF
tara:strand:+ start:160 stop:1065 length:906 start_codon:yes stop_codon:yes gene_type:complete